MQDILLGICWFVSRDNSSDTGIRGHSVRHSIASRHCLSSGRSAFRSGVAVALEFVLGPISLHRDTTLWHGIGMDGRVMDYPLFNALSSFRPSVKKAENRIRSDAGERRNLWPDEVPERLGPPVGTCPNFSGVTFSRI